jgi:hypothetical protein
MQLPTDNTLQLHDIHLPDPAGWWPPAPGWWLLALIMLIIIFWLSRTTYNWLKYRSWRTNVLQEFRYFEQIDNVQFLTQITERLRQLAMTVYPEHEVASLTGQQWLGFLDKHAQQRGFSQYPANLIIDVPYSGQQVELTSQQSQQLIQLSKNWAQHNTGRDNYRRLINRRST